MSQDDDATIERVARAIYEGGLPKGGRDYVAWENLDSDGFYAEHDLAMKQARAALSALPERELLAEALEALAGIEHMTRHSPAISHQREIHDRARAAADKIRDALTQEKQP